MGRYSVLLEPSQPAIIAPVVPTTEPVGKPVDKEASTDVHVSTTPALHMEERRPIQRAYILFVDQVLALEEIQLSHYKRDGKRPELSAMVREALDAYIQREQPPTPGH